MVRTLQWGSSPFLARVGIGALDPAGDSPVPIGSRASVKYDWHNVHHLRSILLGPPVPPGLPQPVQWERTDVQPVSPVVETNDNNIGTGHIEIP